MIIGPFSQILTMDNLPVSGPIPDSILSVIPNACLKVSNGVIDDILPYNKKALEGCDFHEITEPAVALPGFIDAHTHLCFAGTRAADYSQRLSGASYQEIAAKGGGILLTVEQTRHASANELLESLLNRLQKARNGGITTCEIKSGYGLNIVDELKILEVIQEATKLQPITLVPTCLAAHTIPKEFQSAQAYLDMLCQELLPILKKRHLCQRIDIFVDKSAFTIEQAREYLSYAKQLGFSLIIHADQFDRGGALLAADINALSADHLEFTNLNDAHALASSGVIPIVLPGATLGLGLPFAPARMLLDAGLPLVIASDWNPGSAPMGNLLTQAALLGAAQKLTMAETFAAITCRAAKSLEFDDRGVLKQGMRADVTIFSCADYREILYQQGNLRPCTTFIEGHIT